MEKSDRLGEARFIDALVGELAPVSPAASWSRAVAGWLVVAGGFVAFAMLASGPLRPSLDGDLSHGRFLLELALGVFAIIVLLASGLEIGVPGGPSTRWLTISALGVVGLWIGISFFGESLVSAVLSAPSPSMAGKREHCFVEGVLISSVPFFIAMAALRRRALYAGAPSGFLLGLAAAGLPALGMQLACMYEPGHALNFHFSPMLFFAVLGALIAPRLLPAA